MTITTYTQFEQGTPLWFLARLGLPTSSRFQTVMSKGTRDAASKMREDYIDELVAELMTGTPTPEGYKNVHMQRGNDQEAEALAAYTLQSGNKVDKVAFVRDHQLNVGCSPDGLVGEDGGVEIKTVLPKLMVRLLCAPGVPQVHMPQINGNMLVTGRQWWDVAIYCPGFDLYVERIGRSTSYCDEIKRYLDPFQRELESRILRATKEEHTFIGLRKLRDRQFIERLEEDGEQLPMPWPTPTPEPASITEQLRASLALED